MTWVIEISISKQLFCSSKWVVPSPLTVILNVGNKEKMQVGGDSASAPIDGCLQEAACNGRNRNGVPFCPGNF